MGKIKINKWSLKKPLYLDKDDPRYEDQLKQLKKDGFTDSETWGLCLVIAQFVIPRLKRFKDIDAGHPMGISEKKWNKILDNMIFAFEWALEEDALTEHYHSLTTEEKTKSWERYSKGMKSFAKYFNALWW